MSLSPAFPYKAALAVAVIAGAAFFFYARRADGKSLPQALGETVGGAVVDAVNGVATGVVLGVGDAVGIPRTNETECEKAIREGRTWDASFACPAGTFIKSIFN